MILFKRYFKPINNEALSYIDGETNEIKDGFFEALENDYYFLYSRVKIYTKFLPNDRGELYKTLIFIDKNRKTELYFKKRMPESLLVQLLVGDQHTPIHAEIHDGSIKQEGGFGFTPDRTLKNNSKEIKEGIKFLEKIKESPPTTEFVYCRENNYYRYNSTKKMWKMLDNDCIKHDINKSVIIKDSNKIKNKI